MSQLSVLALSAGTAATATLALTLLLRPEPTTVWQEPAASAVLVDRLEQLERRLESRATGSFAITPVQARTEPAPRVVRREVPGENAAPGVQALVERLDHIERRLDVIGKDPLLRAKGLLSSTSPRARREAINLLQRYAGFDAAAMEAIRSMCGDPDAGVRREAVQALGRSGNLAALADVRGLLGDADAGVRREAADSIEDLLRRVDKDSPEFRAGIEALMAHTGDPDRRVREEIIDAIDDLGAKSATPALVRFLSDQDAEVREDAIQALGRHGDGTAIPHLRQLYASGAEQNRLDVAVALARLGDASAFGQETPALVRQARDTGTNSRLRARALGLLGEFGGAAHRGLFEAAMQDASSRVRRAAERALQKLGS